MFPGTRGLGRGVFAALIPWVVAACSPSLSPQDLERKTLAAQPRWESYQEDLKGAIGAGPVAEWQGRPVEVCREGDVFRVTFVLTGPWVGRQAAIPVLLRDPTGATLRHDAVCRHGDQATYDFKLAAQDAGPPAWLEIKFPHGQKRIVLNDRGDWQEK
jgi:hypothetical protein